VIFIPFVFLVAVAHQWSLPNIMVNYKVSVVATLYYIPPCKVPGSNLYMFQVSVMTPNFRVQQLLNGAGVTFQKLCRHLLFVSGRE